LWNTVILGKTPEGVKVENVSAPLPAAVRVLFKGGYYLSLYSEDYFWWPPPVRRIWAKPIPSHRDRHKKTHINQTFSRNLYLSTSLATSLLSRRSARRSWPRL